MLVARIYILSSRRRKKEASLAGKERGDTVREFLAPKKRANGEGKTT